MSPLSRVLGKNYWTQFGIVIKPRLDSKDRQNVKGCFSKTVKAIERDIACSVVRFLGSSSFNEGLPMIQTQSISILSLSRLKISIIEFLIYLFCFSSFLRWHCLSFKKSLLDTVYCGC